MKIEPRQADPRSSWTDLHRTFLHLSQHGFPWTRPDILRYWARIDGCLQKIKANDRGWKETGAKVKAHEQFGKVPARNTRPRRDYVSGKLYALLEGEACSGRRNRDSS